MRHRPRSDPGPLLSHAACEALHRYTPHTHRATALLDYSRMPNTDESGPAIHRERPDDRRERVARVRARLAAHQLPIPPGSRLARYFELAERFAAKELSPAGRGPLRDANELLEANRDFAEFAVIVEHLLAPHPPADPVVHRKLRLVLGGAALPGADANPLARNTQFELYVAALFQRAGIPTLLREPDGILTMGAVRLGVAAKRPGGPAHVARLVRHGAKQLRKAGLVGIIALSLDRLFAPNDERVMGRTIEDLQAAVPTLLDQAVQPLLPTLDHAAAGTPALALLASLVVPSTVAGVNTVGFMSAIFLHAFPHRRWTEAQHAALMHWEQALQPGSRA